MFYLEEEEEMEILDVLTKRQIRRIVYLFTWCNCIEVLFLPHSSTQLKLALIAIVVSFGRNDSI